MRKSAPILMAFALVAFTACSQASKPGRLDGLEWLTGQWERTNAKPGTTARENWTRVSDIEMKGLGYTISGEDTAFVERLIIKVVEDNIYYSAEVAHNEAAVLFKMISAENNKLVFENKEHDFPNIISYQLKENGELLAQISGKGRTIDFPFRRSQ